MNSVSTPHPINQTSPDKPRDLGPLAWCVGEIRQSLQLSLDAMRKQLEIGTAAPASKASLHAARTTVHQANGALRIVDVSGVPLIVEECERQLDMVDRGELELDGQRVDAIAKAYQACNEYLADLLGGRVHQPVVLYPQYRALLELRKAERNHPADLFFPNLRVTVQYSGVIDAPSEEQVVAARAVFERALLAHLRDPKVETALYEMAAAVELIERARAKSSQATFWAVMSALFKGLRSGSVLADIYTKRVLTKLNLLVRKMVIENAPPSERLLTDALFLIARADSSDPAVAQIQQVYGLVGMVPANFDELVYGSIDESALHAAQTAIGRVRGAWEHLAAGQRDEFESFKSAIEALAVNVGNLPSSGLRQIAQILWRAKDMVAGDEAVSDQAAIEVATAILYVEQVLEGGARLSDIEDRRAGELAMRLNRLLSGQQVSADLPDWLAQIARKAQDQVTTGQLVLEIQSNLHVVETALDAWFRDPAQVTNAATLKGQMSQVSGALNVLGHQDAAKGAQALGTKIKVTLESGSCDEQTTRSIAASLGALGFFIEGLQRNEQVQNEFHFVESSGEFVANKILPALTAGPASIATVVLAGTAAVSASALASEIIPQLDVTARVTANDVVQEIIAADAPLLEVTPAVVVEPIPAFVVEEPPAVLVEATPAVVFEATPAVVVEATPAVVIQDRDVDHELMEIFLGEATEVLEAIAQGSKVLKTHPAKNEELTNVRRAFHTLKGSGRMVGLKDFGEAGWAMEQTMNLWMGEKRPASPDLLLLIDQSHTVFTAWVEQLTVDANASVDPAAMCFVAQKMRDGHDISATDWSNLQASANENSVAELAPVNTVGHDVFAESDLLFADVQDIQAADGMAIVDDLDFDIPVLQEEAVGAQVSNLSSQQNSELAKLALEIEAMSLGSDSIKKLEPESALDFDFDALINADTIALDQTAVMSDEEFVNSLQDSELHDSDVFGLDVAAFDNFDIEPAVFAEESSLDLTSEISAFAEEPALFVDDTFAVEPNAFIVEADVFAGEVDAFVAQPEAIEPVFATSVPAFVVPTFIAAAGVAAVSATSFVHAPTVAMAAAPITEAVIPSGPGNELREIFLSEAEDLLETIVTQADHWSVDPSERGSESAKRAVHSLAGSSAIMGLNAVHDIAISLEHFFGYQMMSGRALDEQDVAQFSMITSRLTASLHGFAAGSMPSTEIEAVSAAKQLHKRWANLPSKSTVAAASVLQSAENAAAIRASVTDSVLRDTASFDIPSFTNTPIIAATAAALTATAVIATTNGISDELDADLAPIFVDEAMDILPEIGDNLRQWQSEPTNNAMPKALMRQLHTVKGSARMAGAMRLGQVVHEMESRIESAVALPRLPVSLIDDLQQQYDVVLNLFEVIRDPSLASSQAHVQQVVLPEQLMLSTEVIEPSSALASVASRDTAMVSAVTSSAEAIATVQTVRVRADMLDRLVNEAGEVSITRSRLENQVGTIRQSLADLTDNVSRLRTQLREIEIQAESQISARVANAKSESQFDPLEFDRFTRSQELTRMMAESVNDVATVQQNMLRSVNESMLDLARQGQITRDLQQDLMRVRMVQFSSVSERLYRVVRLASKELDKRVNLDLKGAAAEIDRSVLERMIAPLEHLLRNAVGHGIESRAARLSAGKSEAGEITVEIRQEGNEIAIILSDDGAGLNFGRIRERAESVGLLRVGQAATDADLAELIFMPGFTTAGEVTTTAGRGVGMDVVRAETLALGGRIEIDSNVGKGTRFTLQLPLTLAVTQVVLMRVGEYRFSVPSVLVEQVMQLKPQGLATAYANKVIEWQSREIPFQYMGSLLELTDTTPLAQRYSPVIVMRSGSHHIAVHVDNVIGNQEVVVKNVGPQLARLNGISGATVLGDGEIVLIMNPVQLSQAQVAQNLLRGNAKVPTLSDEQLEAAFATPPTIMVVDDSLTVRKVTQRLLSREGYQVALAKDGVDGLRQLQDMMPDVMLVDIEMPRMDGFDFTRAVRADDRTRHIPIIMITSRTADKHRNHAMSLGVNIYLGKPYADIELLEHIAHFVKAAKSRRVVNG